MLCCVPRYFRRNPKETIISWEETVQFVPPINEGIVIKVHDGDTFTLAAKLPYEKSPLYRFSVRLNGINCPELNSKNEDEKICAYIAKAELSSYILGKKVVLKNIKNEKYGRVLADVYLDGYYLNNHMLEKRLAIPYDGKAKRNLDNWLAFHTSQVK
jgi:endonuclease YncB( thermonuclease family)